MISGESGFNFVTSCKNFHKDRIIKFKKRFLSKKAYNKKSHSIYALNVKETFSLVNCKSRVSELQV